MKVTEATMAQQVATARVFGNKLTAQGAELCCAIRMRVIDEFLVKTGNGGVIKILHFLAAWNSTSTSSPFDVCCHLPQLSIIPFLAAIEVA